MLPLIDLMERAVKGNMVSERDYNFKILFPAVKKIITKYNIAYNPEEPVCGDDKLADSIYNGACELLAESGIYCEETNRIIHIEEHEIQKSVRDYSGGVTFGEGKDCGSIRLRTPGDSTLPWFHVGTGIVASSEDIALAQVEGYGGIGEANSISIPACSRVRGLPVMGGSPLEILATVNSIKAGRKALANCGRPGLPIMNLISSATSSMSTIAGAHPLFGLRASDGWLIDFIAEMKVNFDTLNRLSFIHIIGGNVGSTALPVLGGYAGGPEGTALVMTAYYLAGMFLFGGAYHLTGPIHFQYGCSSTRDSLWVLSVVGRATSRNTSYPAIGLAYAAAGPCTSMYFYEAAAANLSIVTSGYAGVQTVHPAKAVINDKVTPLEAQFNVDVARAASCMDQEEANQAVLSLLDKYEHHIGNAPAGKKYQDCYDLVSRKPAEEYVNMYNEIKEEIAVLGIELE
ncbi:MAG: monomethylamine:corrinoid methyltransferase [Spirochaetota bacterium]